MSIILNTKYVILTIMKNLYEIRIHARAGQGSKTMAQLIAEVAASKGYHIQSFPYFGPARSGAPMDAFVRVSKNEIKIHTPVKKPDLLVVLDETLLMIDNICLILDTNQSLLINTTKSKEEITKKYKIKSKVFVINANKIGKEIFKKLFTNTVMLGAYAKVSDLVSLPEAKNIVRENFIDKYGKLITDLNIKAIEAGYKKVL